MSNTPKTASICCLTLIREAEGFRAKPYLCPAGIPTIGYGNTRYPDGRAVTLDDEPITMVQADQLMRAALVPFEAAVNRYVLVSINQFQFDALVSFTYNVGPQALRKSTLLEVLNRGQYDLAAEQFGNWTLAGGRSLPGLVKRRATERALFLRAGGQHI